MRLTKIPKWPIQLPGIGLIQLSGEPCGRFGVGGFASHRPSKDATNMDVSLDVTCAPDLAAIEQGSHNQPRDLFTAR